MYSYICYSFANDVGVFDAFCFLKVHCSISMADCEVSLQNSHYSFGIVYDRDWPALKNKNSLKFLIRKI